MSTSSFTNKITEYSLICNELLVSIYYAVLALPYLSSIRLSQTRIAFICIDIIIVAFGINFFFNIIHSGISLKNRIRKRMERSKILPTTIEEKNPAYFDLEIKKIITNAN